MHITVSEIKCPYKNLQLAWGLASFWNEPSPFRNESCIALVSGPPSPNPGNRTHRPIPPYMEGLRLHNASSDPGNRPPFKIPSSMSEEVKRECGACEHYRMTFLLPKQL